MSAVTFDTVSFSYREPVLNGASFSIESGEMVALIGDNGSGKSTIAKICAAELAPGAGTAEVLGKNISTLSENGTAYELRQQIGVVLQNPDDQFVSSLVIDEVAFGPENLGLPRDEIIQRVQTALCKVGMLEHLGSNVNTLSGGQKQRVAIADALAMQPALLILDEVTSMLDSEAQHEILELLSSLHEEGMTIMLITHAAEEALLCDRVFEVKDGQVHELPTDADVAERLSFNRIARDVEASVLKHAESPVAGCGAAPLSQNNGVAAPQSNVTVASRGNSHPSAAPLITFDNVSFTYRQKDERGIDIFGTEQSGQPVFNDLSLTVFEGEILAIIGSNGSGKSTLLKLMCGLLSPTSGIVQVCGMPTSDKSGANHARRCVGLSFQYPERSIFNNSVYDEVAFGPRNEGLSESDVASRVERALELVGLPFTAFRDRNPHGLSGGEQRKVSLAGVLALRPSVFALDEPCAGLDIPAHIRFWKMIKDLQRQGQTIVLVSHDVREVGLFADRIFECR